MNEYDSDTIGQLLFKCNIRMTDDHEIADLILINTCSVRAKAEQKAFSLLGRIVDLKRKKPNIILGVMGCIAQQEGRSLFSRFPELDMVIGTREINRLPEILQRVERYGRKVTAIDLNRVPVPIKNQNGYFKGRVKSYISVMMGCNNFCSYCVVPYVRGREISRSPNQILKEAKSLLSNGVKEITLLGQNVNSYYWSEGNVNFPILLDKLSNLSELTRIRFTTSHPKDLSDDLIKRFNDLDNLCPHIHLPFQSGSNRILKLMNRKYTREQYLELIEKLRENNPRIAITSDVMVGFPGESKDDFEMTLDLIRKIEFDNLFSFKYSDRKGTAAEKMGDKIKETEKTSRLSFLQEMQRGITLKKNRELVGKRVEILVDGPGKKIDQYSGRTETNKIVNFKCNGIEIGKIAHILIKTPSINSLYGEILE